MFRTTKTKKVEGGVMKSFKQYFYYRFGKAYRDNYVGFSSRDLKDLWDYIMENKNDRQTK